MPERQDPVVVVPTAPDLCAILQTLVTNGATFASIQKGVPYQAAKVYILSLLLKELSGVDYTNLCSLLASLRPCSSMPDYQLRQAYLSALSQGLVTGSQDDFNARLAGCCCEADMPVLLAAEAFLMGQLVSQGVTAAGQAALIAELLFYSPYAVLGATTVTNTGATSVTGDLGLSPAFLAGITGFPPGVIVGTRRASDSPAPNGALVDAEQVKLTAGIALLNGQAGFVNIGTTNQAGVTLPPGNYSSATTMLVGGGNLTLDGGGNANATFIFKVGTALTLNGGAKILLTNGAQAKNVYWTTGTSATIGAASVMVGSILALASITLVTGASITGHLLASTGAVTLDTNVVVLPPL